MLGALLTGVFAKASISGVASQAGAIDGNPHQIVLQLIGIGWTIGWCTIGTLVILFVVDRLIGLRVSEEIEREGLDRALHGEQMRS
jgi:Amt family ammonium transporter